MNKYYIRYERNGTEVLVLPCYSYDMQGVGWYAQAMLYTLSSVGQGEVEYTVYQGEPDWATSMVS